MPVYNASSTPTGLPQHTQRFFAYHIPPWALICDLSFKFIVSLSPTKLSMKFALQSGYFIAVSFVLLLPTLAENASAAPALSGVSVHAERQGGLGVSKVTTGAGGLEERQWPPLGYSMENTHITTSGE